MRLGIFGGSFDPIHFGHLILAEQCREQAKLDKVIFVPTAKNPLKERVNTKDKHRLGMLSLAIAGHKSFEISDIEVERGGESFTVDTLNQFIKTHAQASIFLMMGEDSMDSFSQWKEPEEICRLSTPLVVRRPGSKNDIAGNTADLTAFKPYMDDEKFQQVVNVAIKSRMIDISGTDIRNRIAAEKSIRFLVPRSVEKYIETNQLFLTT